MLTAKSASAGTDLPNVGQRPALIKPKGGGAKALAELIVDGVVTITPELAHRIIQEAPYEKQRPIRPKHVDALATQMRRREWTPGTQLHFGRLPDGSLHLVNGNHRMHAVVRSDTSVPFQLLVSEVRDEKGLNTLYRRHDRLTSPRTAIDALSAEGIPDAHGLRHEIARACFNAVPVINAHFRPPRHYGDAYLQRSDEARLAAAVEWWPVAGIAQEAITKAPWNIKHRLQSVGVMAVMLVTVRYQELKAYAFWQGLADNNGLSRNDPRASYLRYLSVNRVRGLHETSKSAAIAWNAFYAGEELQIIRVTPGPITIDGTPFNKPPKD